MASQTAACVPRTWLTSYNSASKAVRALQMKPSIWLSDAGFSAIVDYWTSGVSGLVNTTVYCDYRVKRIWKTEVRQMWPTHCANAVAVQFEESRVVMNGAEEMSNSI